MGRDNELVKSLAIKALARKQFDQYKILCKWLGVLEQKHEIEESKRDSNSIDHETQLNTEKTELDCSDQKKPRTVSRSDEKDEGEEEYAPKKNRAKLKDREIRHEVQPNKVKTKPKCSDQTKSKSRVSSDHLYIMDNEEEEEEEEEEYVLKKNRANKLNDCCFDQKKTKRVCSYNNVFLMDNEYEPEEEDEEEYIPERKRKKLKGSSVKTNNDDAPIVIRPMPEGFREKLSEIIKGDVSENSIKLLIQKRLTKTDMRGGQNRLSIPTSNMQEGVDFLYEDEKNYLHEYHVKGTPVNSYDVKLVSLPSGQVHDHLAFCRWIMDKDPGKDPSISYVLRRTWFKQVVCNKRNGLKEKDEVQLWSFRVHNKLTFALLKVS